MYARGSREFHTARSATRVAKRNVPALPFATPPRYLRSGSLESIFVRVAYALNYVPHRMRAVAFVIVTSLAACQPPGYSTHHDVDASGSGATDAPAPTIDASPDAPVSGVCNDMFRLDGHGAASTAWVS